MPLLPALSTSFTSRRELEVAGQVVADQERVVVEAGRLADDLAVLDAPERRVARPAGEVLAVKELGGIFGR